MEAANGWIEGVEFPATKIELIDAAADAGASDELIGQLQQLQREQYESRGELESELG
jgi:hypothetical protein